MAQRKKATPSAKVDSESIDGVAALIKHCMPFYLKHFSKEQFSVKLREKVKIESGERIPDDILERLCVARDIVRTIVMTEKNFTPNARDALISKVEGDIISPIILCCAFNLRDQISKEGSKALERINNNPQSLSHQPLWKILR